MKYCIILIGCLNLASFGFLSWKRFCNRNDVVTFWSFVTFNIFLLYSIVWRDISKNIISKLFSFIIKIIATCYSLLPFYDRNNHPSVLAIRRIVELLYLTYQKDKKPLEVMQILLLFKRVLLKTTIYRFQEVFNNWNCLKPQPGGF